MKKLSVLLTTIMLVVTLLAGCGSKKETVSDKKAAPESKEEIVTDSQSEETSDEKQSTEKGEKAPAPAKKPQAEPTEEKEDTPATSLESVKNAIITIAGIKDPLDVPTARLSSLYGIEPSMVKQSACFVTIEGAFPDEIVMIEAVDEAAADSIAALLNNRLAEVKEQSKSYDAENYALAQQCSVDKKGCFVTMFLTPQHANMKIIYDGLTK